MEEATGVVCDDCGRFIREGPPAESEDFPGRTFYVRSLCEKCLPYHDCQEFEQRRRKWYEGMRRWFRTMEHPGQQELDFG